ncbi:MAG: hypothetical protein WDO72_01935 [Pseudomonadota bacterium]
MGPAIVLWNATKREHVSFHHVGASTRREVAGNSVSAAIVTWYLIQNVGDDISLHAQWDEHEVPNPVYSEAVLNPDRMDHVVAALINAGILKDEGFNFRDDEDPQVYVRHLRNIWGD